ncbi:hypothetical protein K432DRAFT_383448 [Lepidopterella palustris CBS 459.81]|uniref:F-box domain-containing protein n=1 Tax=Lepidopterella palustris CBS 459.81 TaxID=1314670 RepID=A0A8E2JDU3_9PEZI|nr:hypothetical protein K432DRAFT_383448 [Lepidopterella palustris CBS 459.81]
MKGEERGTEKLSPGSSQDEIHLTQCHLLELPAELIQQIASFTTPSAAAALALTSRSLCAIIGTGVWERVGNAKRDTIEDRSEFLLLLERDLPSYFFCSDCSIMHVRLMPGVPYTPHPYTPYPYKKHDRTVNAYYPMPGDPLHYQDFRALMERHHWGVNFGRPISSIYRDIELQRAYCTIRLQTRGRIIDNELILRMHWELSGLEPGADGISLEICPHQSLQATPSSLHQLPVSSFMDLIEPVRNELANVVCCKWLHVRPRPANCPNCKKMCKEMQKRGAARVMETGVLSCSMCEGVRRCGHCATDYEVSVVRRAKQLELHIDAWLNLGYGSFLEDPNWLSHKMGSREWALTGEGQTHAVSLAAPGTIKTAYYSLDREDGLENPMWWAKRS